MKTAVSGAKAHILFYAELCLSTAVAGVCLFAIYELNNYLAPILAPVIYRLLGQ